MDEKAIRAAALLAASNLVEKSLPSFTERDVIKLAKRLVEFIETGDLELPEYMKDIDIVSAFD